MRDRGWLQAGAYWAMLACIVIVLVSVFLPNTALAWMRDNITLFNLPMLWIENAHSPINLVHLILFFLLGVSTGVARPAWHAGWVLVVIALLGIGTELLQIEIPGRHPRIADAVVDIGGAAAGLLVVHGIRLLLDRILGWTTKEPFEDPGRQACIAFLRGDALDALTLSALSPEVLLASAQREGVVSLLAQALNAIHEPSPAIEGHRQIFVEAARREAVRNLWCQAQCRAITAALGEAGIDSIWMKGAALSQWLYSQPHLRDLADIDLLLPDHATTMRAAAVLAPLGYTLPNPYIAGDLVVHELLAWSDRAQLELDLHWDLNNYPLLARRIPWARLQAEAIPLRALGEGARALSPVHAFVHACVHRAANALTGREDRLRWLYEIHLLAVRFDVAQWQRVLREAIDAELADSSMSALRASRRVFETPVPDGVIRSLDDAAKKETLRTEHLGSWSYWQLATWRRLPDMHTRLRWLRQLLFPNMAHLQARYGADGAGAFKLSMRRLLDGWRRWRGWVGF